MSCNAQLYYCYVSKIPFIFVLLVITFLYLFVRIKCDNRELKNHDEVHDDDVC